jgi:VanZ family protein
MLVSAVDEFHQVFLPGRSAGLDDWLAGGAGVLLAFALLRHTPLDRLIAALRGH